MSTFSLRNALPVVTSVVSALFLVTAGSQEPAAQASAPPQVARVEVQHCVANGRDLDDCLDEADGKALIERADWLARSDDAARRASQP